MTVIPVVPSIVVSTVPIAPIPISPFMEVVIMVSVVAMVVPVSNPSRWSTTRDFKHGPAAVVDPDAAIRDSPADAIFAVGMR